MAQIKRPLLALISSASFPFILSASFPVLSPPLFRRSASLVKIERSFCCHFRVKRGKTSEEWHCLVSRTFFHVLFLPLPPLRTVLPSLRGRQTLNRLAFLYLLWDWYPALLSGENDSLYSLSVLRSCPFILERRLLLPFLFFELTPPPLVLLFFVLKETNGHRSLTHPFYIRETIIMHHITFLHPLFHRKRPLFNVSSSVLKWSSLVKMIIKGPSQKHT